MLSRLDSLAAKLWSPNSLVAVLALAVRLWMASQWLNAGWHKLTDPAWMDGSGRGLLHFWTSALAPTHNGQSAITFDWYRAFLQFMVDAHAAGVMAKVIASSEFAVGLGVLLGACVGLAAVGGLTMNMAYMLAGSLSTNPLLALAAGVLILIGKRAGAIGLDRYLVLGPAPRVATARLRAAALIMANI